MAKTIKAKANTPESGQKVPEWLIWGIIFLLSFIIYGQTIRYDYALDDSMVIKNNEFTKKGIQGIGDILSNDTFVGYFGKQKNLVAGGRYRPLSLVTFAIEYELLGPTPGFSHFINILLYALTGILLFKVLSKLLKKFSAPKWYFSIPFLATIFFLAHPVHTEVVANIKGRDEILTFLGSLAALWFTLKFLEQKHKKYLAYSFIAFFLALLAKENAITFVVVIPLAVYFFTGNKLRESFIATIPLILAGAIFLFIRQLILGSFSAPIAKELLNNPFLNASIGDKFATIFYTLGLYIKLLIFPHPLTYDYYPKQIPVIGWTDIRALGSFLIYALMAVYALVAIRKKSIVSFCILFYIITLSVVSNLVFPVGTFMNERFIYISSLGFSIVIAYLVASKLPLIFKDKRKLGQVTSVLIILILVAYGVKSVARTMAWKNDYTLFTTDVKTSRNSAKANAAAASMYREKALAANNKPERDENYRLAIQYFTRALEIYPEFFDVSLDLALAHYKYNGDIKKTEEYLLKAFELDASNPKAMQFASAIFNELNNPAQKLAFFLKLNQSVPGNYEVNHTIGSVYGKDLNNIPLAIEYLSNAVKINPAGFESYKDLMVAYGMNRDYENSFRMAEMAIKLNPKDPKIYFNMGINYQNMGNAEKAKEFFTKANQMEQTK